MSDPKATAEGWAASVAAMAVDALVDAGLVAREQFTAARAVVAEEVLVRLCVRDYPPPVDDATVGHAIAELREQRHAEPGAAADGGGRSILFGSPFARRGPFRLQRVEGPLDFLGGGPPVEVVAQQFVRPLGRLGPRPQADQQ